MLLLFLNFYKQITLFQFKFNSIDNHFKIKKLAYVIFCFSKILKETLRYYRGSREKLEHGTTFESKVCTRMCVLARWRPQLCTDPHQSSHILPLVKPLLNDVLNQTQNNPQSITLFFQWVSIYNLDLWKVLFSECEFLYNT